MQLAPSQSDTKVTLSVPLCPTWKRLDAGGGPLYDDTVTVKVQVPPTVAAASWAWVGPLAAVEVVAPQLPHAPSTQTAQITAAAVVSRFTAQDHSAPRHENERVTDIPTLASLLHETAQRHDQFEKTHEKHDWWDWYAAYMAARGDGREPDAASAEATRYMEDEKHIARV